MKSGGDREHAERNRRKPGKQERSECVLTVQEEHMVEAARDSEESDEFLTDVLEKGRADRVSDHRSRDRAGDADRGNDESPPRAGQDKGDLEKIVDFCTRRLNMALPTHFRDASLSERRSFLFRRLNRPLRVCGMVKNEGEPGGGPFWVDDPDGKGGASLQIIEESQIDRGDPKQRTVWSSATHFNPVDIICGVRDFRGRKFDLPGFVDPAMVVITRKSEKGRELLALERPGLWNGSMAFWNTVFIEVPIATFNPVKTVADLLRPQHMCD